MIRKKDRRKFSNVKRGLDIVNESSFESLASIVNTEMVRPKKSVRINAGPSEGEGCSHATIRFSHRDVISFKFFFP